MIQSGSNSPEDINELVQSVLGLYNIPAQQFFTNNLAGQAQNANNLYQIAGNRMNAPTNLPGVPGAQQFNAADVYSGGSGAKADFQKIIANLNAMFGNAPYQGGIDTAAQGIQDADYTELDAGAPGTTLDTAASTAGGLGVDSRVSGMKAPDATLATSDVNTLLGEPDYENARQAYRGDIESAFEQQVNQLEHELAVEGRSNSSYAREARTRLADAKARALANADLQALQVVGGERRADTGIRADVLNRLFGQKATGAQLGLQGGLAQGGEQRANTGLLADIQNALFGQRTSRVGFGQSQALARGGEGRSNLGALLGASTAGIQNALAPLGALQSAAMGGEQTDLARRGAEFERMGAQQGAGQLNYENLLNNFLQGENIFNQRLSATQNPLSMLLSALSGVNVSPGTVGPLQMPRQQPGVGEIFGQVLGGLASNAPNMFKFGGGG